MSKFLSKLWVMVTLIAVSVVLLGTYVYLLARPISYGMWYSASANTGVEGENAELDLSIKFIDGKKLVAKVSSGGTVAETEMWYINNGDQVFFLTDGATYEMNEETFDAMVEQLKAEEAEWNALWSGEADPMDMGFAYNISAFNMKANIAGIEQADQDNLVCDGAISLAVIMGIIEIAFITFAVLSVIYYIKGKKVVVTTASEEKVEEVVVTEEKKEE